MNNRGLVAIAGLLALSTACGQPPVAPPDSSSAGTQPRSHFSSAAPRMRSARKLGFPPTIVATPDPARRPAPGVGWLRTGTPVPARDVRLRRQLDGTVVVGLADRGSLFGTVYPAISDDRGRTWAIDGPEFAYAAAQGASTTDRLAVTRDRTIVAWGYGGAFVKVSSDLGWHWAESLFGSGVDYLWTDGHRIVVRALGDWAPPGERSGRLETWYYVSTDDGRRWRRARRGRPGSGSRIRAAGHRD